jgi:hypothetical protein
MSNPELAAGRDRPTGSAAVSHLKMTAVDIERVARAVEAKFRERTPREAYLGYSATYDLAPFSSSEGDGNTVLLVPAEERTSYTNFRYSVSKIRWAGKP